MATPLDMFGQMDFKALLGNLFNMLVILFVIIISAALVYVLYRRKNKQDSGTKKEIYWWEEVNGRLIPNRKDTAEEISIPGTNLKLFYIKKSNMWLPRFTKGITLTMFYVAITPRKEIINFTLKSLEKDMDEAGLDYDHTDMRWAAENLREFVKRNYKDKATPWWREFKDVITTALYILVMTFSLVIIIYFLRGVISDIGGVAAGLETALERISACSPNAGSVVVQGA